MARPLNLKQRLAALSTATTSPHRPEPRSPLFPIGMKRKINVPWARRSHPNGNGLVGTMGDEESEVVQEVMTRIIFQAGVDFETRPMVVFNASALPDPRDVSYDLLLALILSYLDLYVESDYTVVFFAAGGKHTPSTNWIWKAYRSLSRKYRKNLKQLYIVHSSFFSKMLFSLAGAIISPKFFRKLVYIKTLSDLAQIVPVTQIDIPPSVYQENLKFERTIVLPTPIRSHIFGVPLEDLMGYGGEKGGLPRVVKDSIQYLRENGLLEVGIFRRSPPTVMLKAAQDAYDRGNVVSLDSFGDPHLAAVLLKKYMRDLPDPVFPESLYPVINQCPPPSGETDEMASILYIRETLLPVLPPCIYILLSHVLHLMHEISLRAESNRMDAYNLSLVLCPNLVKGPNPVRDVMMCAIPGGPAILQSNAPTPAIPGLKEGQTTLGMVILACIRRYYEIFDEVRDRSEALPQPRAFAADSRPQRPLSYNEDDDSIDDAMLVMPIGPPEQSSNGRAAAGLQQPPSAHLNGGSVPYRPRQRNRPSGSGVPSVHSAFGAGNGSVGGPYGYPSMGKAKSIISIEPGAGTQGKKGSISVGRGTTRKSSGAGVEAFGITAEGFFSPPSSAPPVPQWRARDVLGVDG